MKSVLTFTMCEKTPGKKSHFFPGGTKLFLPSAINLSPVSSKSLGNQRFLGIFRFIIKAYTLSHPIIACQEPGRTVTGRKSKQQQIRTKHEAHQNECSHICKTHRATSRHGLPSIPIKGPGIASKKVIQTRKYALTTNELIPRGPDPDTGHG